MALVEGGGEGFLVTVRVLAFRRRRLEAPLLGGLLRLSIPYR